MALANRPTVMINLAAFRYRNVFAGEGGPIDRVELSETTDAGARSFLANAYLRDDLVAWRPQKAVYGTANGSGTDASPMIARFKAISEALERWAQMDVLTSARRLQFGFDADPSSNGMAAFPGLFTRQARPAALMEAAERFNLLSWWEGRLSALETATRWPGVSAAVLCSEAPGVTVVLFRQGEQGNYAYGHAAGLSFEDACKRARMEMERHDQVVRRFQLAHAGQGSVDLPANVHTIERRTLFFASEAGHELFLGRLRSRPWRPTLQPRVLFDGVIPGPWSRYADVWRVAYAPVSERYLSRDENFFYW